MALFGIHFICLVNPGDGDGFMSSEFQATLNSKSMQDVPVDVMLGSRVSIRHHNTHGGYLHSHNHMYPGGSKQQQITLYPHKDENNVWLLENQTQPLDPNGEEIKGLQAWDQEPKHLENGAVVRLYHLTTHRRLHSHDVRPPVSEADWQNEVSAYGYEGFEGDANDLFRVEIIKSMSDGAKAKEVVRTIETKFKLVHIMTGCSLFSHKVKLPDWGFDQQEVTCAKQGTLPNSIWYVEQNEHPTLGPNSEKVNYKKPGFFGKFWELQKVMWTTNAGLVESHAWDSRPPSWPWLRRGINFWGKDHRQIYLLGNPVVWWSSTLAIFIYAAFKGFSILRWQRGYNDYDSINYKRFDYEIGMSVLGWAFHYFPFFLMQRQLFLHHYLPALYFAIIALCQVYDFAMSRIEGPFGFRDSPAIGRTGVVAFLAASVVAFTIYAPLSYGNPWTQDSCKNVKLFDTWDFDCNNFHTSVSPKLALSINLDANLALQLDLYDIEAPSGSAQQTDGPAIPSSQQVAPAEQVTPQAAVENAQVKKEEKVEYRDQDGNLLDEAHVEALRGKVSFNTKYETRTRVVDADGNDVDEGPAGGVEGGFAPPHPDVERLPSTGKDDNDDDGREYPATASPEEDVGKEKSVDKENKGKPKPGSEGNQATPKKDEL